MAKKFYKRSILKPEKTKEEENWEKEEEERLSTKNKKAPTTVFDGINKDKYTRACHRAIMQDISQGEREEELER